MISFSALAVTNVEPSPPPSSAGTVRDCENSPFVS